MIKTNQIIKDMLRACYLVYIVSQAKIVPLMEFAYNNSYQVTIKMIPYKAFYGKRCWSFLYQGDMREKDSIEQLFGPNMTWKMIQDV